MVSSPFIPSIKCGSDASVSLTDQGTNAALRLFCIPHAGGGREIVRWLATYG